MSLRNVFVCVLGLLGACASDASVHDAADAGAPAVYNQTLTFVAGGQISVLPNDSRVLTVRYQDERGAPVVGAAVEFALTGSAPGASLTPAHAVTDVSGLASTSLRVGSTTGDLMVRARAASGVTQYATVSVSEALGAQLSVSVDYKGQREISSFTVTSLPSMTCAAALKAGLAGDVSYTFPVSSQPVRFALGSGLSSAIVGFGRDDNGAKLALGCKEFTAPITADSATAMNTLVLSLGDQTLSFDNELSLELQLDVAASSKRLSDSAQAAVDQALTPGGQYAMFAEADYYLDAITAALTKQEVKSVATLTERRAAEALSASLNPALAQAAVGPKAVGTAVGALLLARGAGITLHTTYKAGLLGPIRAASALSADGATQLALAKLPTASIVASFSSEKAALLISSLRVDLALGDYGVALLGDIMKPGAGPAPGRPAPLAAADGCSTVLGPWWSAHQLTSVCDVSVAVAACEGAVSALVTSIEAELVKLDAKSASLQLSGTVHVEDRSEDGQVDDLGHADLTGSWGADAALGQLRVPVKTAFAR